MLVFTAIFGLLYTAVIVAAALWRDAPRRRWFRPAGTLPALFFFGPDLGRIAGLITQPSWAAFFGLLVLVGLGTLIVAAVASYRDAHQVLLAETRSTWRAAHVMQLARSTINVPFSPKGIACSSDVAPSPQWNAAIEATERCRDGLART